MTRHGFPENSLEDIVFTEASRTVIGVASARLRGHVEDATVVTMDYMRFALARGMTETRAWSLLTSAAIAEFTERISELAIANGTTAEETLQQVGIGLVRKPG